MRLLRRAGRADEDGRVPFAQRHGTAVVQAERGARAGTRGRFVRVLRRRDHTRPGEDVHGRVDFERGRRAERQQRPSHRRGRVDQGRGDRPAARRQGRRKRTAQDPAGRPGADRRPGVRSQNRLLRLPARRHDRFLQEFVRGQRDQHDQVRVNTTL